MFFRRPQYICGRFFVKLFGVILIKYKGKFLGPFYCILAAVVWGLSFVAQSEGAGIGTFTFNALRMLLGGIVLLPFAIFSLVKGSKNDSAEEKNKNSIKNVLIGGACCAIPFFLGCNLQQHAFFLDLGPGKVGFITALYMVLVPIAGIFMKQKLRFNIWVGVVLGVVGLYLLSVPAGGFSIGSGEMIAICGAFAFAAHILVIDHFCQKVNNVALSCAQYIIAGIVSSIFMFIFEEPSIEAIKGVGVEIAYAGIMSCAVAFTAQIFGQKYTEPAIASILLCLESVFAVLFGWLLLHEQLSSRELIGCAIMFVAILLTQIPADIFKLKRKEK